MFLKAADEMHLLPLCFATSLPCASMRAYSLLDRCFFASLGNRNKCLHFQTADGTQGTEDHAEAIARGRAGGRRLCSRGDGRQADGMGGDGF